MENVHMIFEIIWQILFFFWLLGRLSDVFSACVLGGFSFPAVGVRVEFTDLLWFVWCEGWGDMSVLAAVLWRESFFFWWFGVGPFMVCRGQFAMLAGS